MSRRNRNVKLEFWVTPQEQAIIQNQMEKLGTTNMRHISV
jgi:hypothetical protein